MLKNLILSALAVFIILSYSACNESTVPSRRFSDNVKIVSLNGAVSEILVELGFEDNIVGVDVASNYPASLQEKPKAGHSRQLSAEGVLALGPDLVLATTEDVTTELAAQIRNAGVKLQLIEQDYSLSGTKRLIQQLADSLDRPAKGDSLIAKLDADFKQLKDIKINKKQPKVLFIYARGTGTMMVAGNNTAVDKMIEFSGGQNAVKGFEDFRPLTAEALVAANPDVILLFDSGLSSLGGVQGLLEVQGIPQTNAGRNRKVVQMEGQLLTGFGPRLGLAVLELARKIHED